VAKKVNLPVLGDSMRRGESKGEVKGEVRKAKRPSLEDARTRLGGSTRGASIPPTGVVPGRVVTIPAAGGGVRTGVVVFASASEVHVLVDGVRLRKVAPASLTLVPASGDEPLELAKIAADAHVFGTLVEGQPVRYADESSGLTTGKLVEKCRYGALVVRDDGTVVAVGFRKLWPAVSSGAA